MFKFYRTFVYQLVVVLYWIESQTRAVSYEQIRQAVETDLNRLPRLDNGQSYIFNAARYTGPNAPPGYRADGEVLPNSAGELVDAIIAQTNGERNDADLIDTMVDLLQSSFVKGRLNGETLARLRKAILIPEELVGLKERLKANELHCTTCNRLLGSGELVIFDRSNPEGAGIHCTNCATPHFVACSGCKKYHGVAKALINIIGKHRFCDDCKHGTIINETAAADPMLPPMPNAGNVVLEPPPLPHPVFRQGAWNNRIVAEGNTTANRPLRDDPGTWRVNWDVDN